MIIVMIIITIMIIIIIIIMITIHYISLSLSIYIYIYIISLLVPSIPLLRRLPPPLRHAAWTEQTTMGSPHTS